MPSADPDKYHQSTLGGRWVGFVVALLMLTVVSSSQFLLAQQMPIRKYGLQEGLPQISVQALLQDKYGFLWLGTQSGISRFDGIHFVTYSSEDGLGNNYVQALLADSLGRMWLGTQGGLSYFTGKQFINLAEGNGLPGNNVKALALAPTGGIWVGTDAGLAFYDGHAFKVYKMTEGLPHNHVHALQQDAKGRLWIATEGGIAVWDGVHFTRYTSNEGLPSNVVRALALSHDGTIWCGTLNGVAYFSGNRFQAVAYPAGLVRNPNTTTLLQDSKGNWRFGLSEEGMLTLENGKWELLNEANGLSAGNILSLFEDDIGNIWLGTYGGGLNKYNCGPFQRYTMQEGLVSNTIRASCRDAQGNLWIGGVDGKLSIWDGKRFTSFGPAQGIPPFTIRAIVKDARGQMWVGTDGGGIARWDGNRFTSFSVAQGMAGKSVYAMTATDDGSIWCALADGGISRFDGTRFTNLTVREGMPSNRPQCIYLDRQKKIWVGFYDAGAIVINPNKLDALDFTRYTQQDGLSSDAIYAITQDAEGAMWFGTFGGGAVRLDLTQPKGSQFQVYDTRQGLAASIVWALATDAKGNIWMGGPKGINVLDPKTKVIRYYGYLEGLTPVGVNARGFYKDNLNQLWIGTTGGVVRYMPGADQISTSPPKVYVTQITFKGKKNPQQYADSLHPFLNVPVSVDGSPALKLPPDHNDLSFHFAALHFKTPENNRYRYKLEGYDTDWSPVTDQTRVDYTALDGGMYTFKVQACNADGVWSTEPAALTFHIQTPWHRAWWAILLYLISIGLLVYGIARWRNYKLLQEKNALELTVVERTHEVIRQKTELESANQEILAKNENLAHAASEISRQNVVLNRKNEELFQKNEDLIRALEELRSTQEQLLESEKVATMGKWVAGLAHEINTPIGAIRASAGSLEQLLADALQGLPAFLRELSDAETSIFTALTTAEPGPELSTREQRDVRKHLTKQLAKAGYDESQFNLSEMAAILQRSGIHDAAQVADVFRLPHANDLLDQAGRIRRLRYSVRVINSSAAKTGKAIFALNTFTSNDSQGVREPVSIKANIEYALEPYASFFKQGITLRTQWHALPTVSGHQTELAQLWGNLALNACQAIATTGLPGTLSIDTFIDPPALADFAQAPNGYARIVFADDGPGIPPEAVSRIFEPFFTTKPEGEGTGLGLYLARKIVDRHGGHIDVSSQPGRTVFTIRLPRIPQNESEAVSYRPTQSV